MSEKRCFILSPNVNSGTGRNLFIFRSSPIMAINHLNVDNHVEMPKKAAEARHFHFNPVLVDILQMEHK